MPAERKPTAHFYVRVSTEDQTTDQQLTPILRFYEYALKPKGFVTWTGKPEKDYYEDKAVSGDMRFTKRPAGCALNLRAEKGDCIVVAKLDRAFRSVLDAMTMLDIWHRRGITVYFLDAGVDTSTAFGAAMVGVLAVFAQFERRRMSERMKEKIAWRRQQGLPFGPHPAYGKKVVGKKGHRYYVDDPEEQQWIDAIYEMHMKGHSFCAIWRWLWTNRVSNRGKEWSIKRVERVIRYEHARRNNPPDETPKVP